MSGIPAETVSSQRCPADGKTGCMYHERNRHCGDGPVYRVQLDGKQLDLCDRHARPEFWPDDLRKKLPGRLRRLAVALSQQRGERS